jgi:hypothetical protein
VTYYDPRGTPPALPARKRAAARQQLEQVVARSGRRRRWQRPGFTAVAGAVVAVGTSAAAFTLVHYQAVTNKSDARCYTVASTAGGDHYTTIAAAGVPGSRGRVDHALSVCGDLWREGFLTAGAPGIIRPTNTTFSHRVPALVVCTMSDGTAAVLPGPAGTCAKLGLAAAANP